MKVIFKDNTKAIVTFRRLEGDHWFIRIEYLDKPECTWTRTDTTGRVKAIVNDIIRKRARLIQPV